jgi:hypothetical protein
MKAIVHHIGSLGHRQKFPILRPEIFGGGGGDVGDRRFWVVGDRGKAELAGRLTASLPLVARHPFSGWALYFR